ADRIRPLASPAAKPGVTTPPPAVIPTGSPFSVTVTVQDATAQPGGGQTGMITLALGPGSSPGATLGGTTTALIDPNNGTATFTGLTVSQPGTGYTLVASTENLTSAPSAPFNVGDTA